MLQLATRVRFEHVPYRGAAPMMTDLLAGRIGFCMSNPPTALPAVRDGRVRAIGITSRARLPAPPDTPSLVESGFPSTCPDGKR